MIDELEKPAETAAPAPITRPPLDPDAKDYSGDHDHMSCAIEIDSAYGRGLVTKLGHVSTIIEAHFPRSRDVYRSLEELKLAADALEEARQRLADSRSAKDRALAETLRSRAFNARWAYAGATGGPRP